jgi:transposase-like protein
MEQGYRESAAAWSEVLRSLKERGLAEAPLLAVGDGALGLWAALDEIFPATRHQRCWNHRGRKESTYRIVAAEFVGSPVSNSAAVW